MALINKTGITDGGTIQAAHVTRSIDALSGGSTDTIIATGSFSGSFTGTLTGTASFATTSATEYMTLRLSSGLVTGVTSGSAIYIGTAVTSSVVNRVGVVVPFNCTIMSASLSLNTPTSINATFNPVILYQDSVNILNFKPVDPKNVYLDSDVKAVNAAGTQGKYLTVGFTSNTTATGLCSMVVDVLIKKT